MGDGTTAAGKDVNFWCTLSSVLIQVGCCICALCWRKQISRNKTFEMLLYLMIALNFPIEETNWTRTRIDQDNENKTSMSPQARKRQSEKVGTIWSAALTFFSPYSAMHGCTMDTPFTQGTEETKNKFPKGAETCPGRKAFPSTQPVSSLPRTSEERATRTKYRGELQGLRGSYLIIWPHFIGSYLKRL